jgi:hypothetical protein
LHCGHPRQDAGSSGRAASDLLDRSALHRRAEDSEKDATAFKHGCDLFEQGFILALRLQKKPAASGQPMDSDGAADEGRAPDYSTDPTLYNR